MLALVEVMLLSLRMEDTRPRLAGSRLSPGIYVTIS